MAMVERGGPAVGVDSSVGSTMTWSSTRKLTVRVREEARGRVPSSSSHSLALVRSHEAVRALARLSIKGSRGWQCL